MKSKRCLALLPLALATLTPVLAQDADKFEAYKRQKQQQFDDYRARKYREFEAYRQRKSREFAEYAKQKWAAFYAKPGIPVPEEPKPVQPPAVEPDRNMPKPVKPVPLPQGDVVTPPSPKPMKPIDIPPMPQKDRDEQRRITLTFYGTPCRVTLADDLRFQLSDISEQAVSAQLLRLSGSEYAPLVADCAALQKDMKLNGWATLKLCEQVATRLEGSDTNETAVLEAWLLSQLGYDVRMARCADRLIVLCPFAQQAYTYSYLTIGGREYYLIDKRLGGTSGVPIYTYQKNMSDATRAIDFDQPALMTLDYAPSAARTVQSKRYPEARVTVSVNKNLMDYYAAEPYFSKYPWGFYARQPLDERTRRQLLPPLRTAIAGKSQVEQVAILLDFMQFGFDYATDEQQFGFEKPFFIEENFYYPKNDCEDRAILLTYLVRQLVGLQTVLLYCPGHLWAAVAFVGESVPGDYVTVDGQRYTVTDPTYIGAGIGQTQTAYRGKQPIVIR